MIHMATPAPAPEDDPEDPFLFAPVPTPSRATGWTSDKQICFIESLRRTGVIARAARSVGMSASAAYQLRKRAGPDSGFARAWDAALDEAQMMAIDAIREQGFGPRREAVWFRGRQVGWRTRSNDRLLFAALRGMDGMHARFTRAGHSLADFACEDDAPRNDIAPSRNNGTEPP